MVCLRTCPLPGLRSGKGEKKRGLGFCGTFCAAKPHYFLSPLPVFGEGPGVGLKNVGRAFKLVKAVRVLLLFN